MFENPKYKPNKKNGGNVPPLNDKRAAHVPVQCGNCIECRKQKTNEWRIRLMEDLKIFQNAKFVTLTFSNESYAKLAAENTYYEGYYLDNWIATRAVRYFTERWRKKYKKAPRHWLITELGDGHTEHLHLHGLIWMNDRIVNPKNQTIEKAKHVLQTIWQYGRTDIGEYVNERTINYITKYVTKTDPAHKHYKPVILSSKGIGKNYLETHNSKLNKYNNTETNELYTTKSGHKIALPKYYKNHIYNDKEKEELWMQKLDKAERYILGTKVDISKSDAELLTALKQAKKINREMGYGGHFNYQEAEHEMKKRELKQQERGVIKDKIQQPTYGREIPDTITGEEIIMNYRQREEWKERELMRNRAAGTDDI